LHAISTDNTLTREQISQQLDVPIGTIKRDITVLRKNGFLDRTDGNTYGNWVILKDFNRYDDDSTVSVPS
jgi:DeoR/GlpR family transcriptional regulator of sugar metabolism